MPAKKTDIIINLLPEDPFFQTIFGRSLRWILSIGRYLVIFTELVVIVSFATRFTLDRKITDLNRSIAQKMSVIESYGDLEQRFIKFQAKIDQYVELTKGQNLTNVFTQLSAITPREVSVEKLTISQDKIIVSGQSLNQESFNSLINNLQLSKNFTEVSVGKITVNADKSGYNFQFVAKVNNL